MIGRPGEVVLVASGGDDDLVDRRGPIRAGRSPRGATAGGPGYDPVDGRAAINHLEAQRARGARYFVLPKPAFGWRYRYPELFEHLETAYQRVHQDEHLVVYDLAGDASAGAPRSTRPRGPGARASEPTQPTAPVRRPACSPSSARARA